MKFRRSERKKERNDHNQWKERKGHMERIDKIVEKCCSYKIYTNLVYAVHANKSIQSECFVVAIGVLFICASEPMFIHIDVSKTDSPNVFLAFYFLFTRLFWRCCCCNFRNFQPPKLKNAIRVSITNIPLAVCTCSLVRMHSAYTNERYWAEIEHELVRKSRNEWRRKILIWSEIAPNALNETFLFTWHSTIAGGCHRQIEEFHEK